MGMNYTALRFLMLARKDHGVRFESLLTLGRQTLYLQPSERRALAAEFGAMPDPQGGGEDAYADGVFRGALGATTLDSLDVSDYEGATRVHDMNLPSPVAWDECADTVLDGGALEHVFNFPTALASCMRMVRTGGHLALVTVANNNCGHGFYQFSPELFFRALSPQYGFETIRVIAVPHLYPGSELGGIGRWYDVRDPADLGERVVIMNGRGVSLLVLARKSRHLVPFSPAPQQSDYTVLWKMAGTAGILGTERTASARLRTTIADSLPVSWLNAVRGVRQRAASSLFNRKHFRPLPR